MKSFSIEDIKTFMNDLLVNERYDSFYLFEARIKTGLDYYIRGKINKEFFDYDIKDSLEEYELWGNVKETVFSLMKGKRLPVSFKIILMFNNENVGRLIEMNNLPVAPTDITGLFYNINYEDEKLSVTTGTSLKVFTLDKTLDNLWDDTVGKYYI
ncbi:MAG: DUF5721 family protein [Lachnospiraceae bacterium]|nr:DUF5721 family protein [Lachnospiraceae bacterium]